MHVARWCLAELGCVLWLSSLSLSSFCNARSSSVSYIYTRAREEIFRAAAMKIKSPVWSGVSFFQGARARSFSVRGVFFFLLSRMNASSCCLLCIYGGAASFKLGIFLLRARPFFALFGSHVPSQLSRASANQTSSFCRFKIQFADTPGAISFGTMKAGFFFKI